MNLPASKGWREIKIRWLFQISSGDAISADHETSDGYPLVGGNGVRGFVEDSNTEGPLIVVGRVGALCGNVHEYGGKIWASEHALRLKPLGDVVLRFFTYALEAADLHRLAGGTAQPVIAASRLAEEVVGVPPLPTQRTIAAFLDRETAKIDALIEKKRRLLDLLDEKRTALITRAVTRGLDPDVPMKDSGVEWLGEIPAHWEVELNRRLFRQTHRRSKTGNEELLSVSHITGVTPRSEKPDVTMIEAESHEGYRICEVGDLAVNTMWAWMGALGIVPVRGIVSPSYNVYRIVTDDLLPAYYDYVSRTPAHVAEIIRHSQGVWKSRLRLYPDAFGLMSTPLPPLREQMQIVEFLDRESERMSSLSKRIDHAISLLQQYRTALISAAVTGQIDVSEAAA